MNARQRNLVGLGVLLTVAGAIGLFAYFGVARRDARQEEEQQRALELFEVRDPAAFTRLTIEAKGEKTTLEKTPDGGWRLTSPVQTAADASAVRALLGELASAKLRTKVEESSGDAELRRYGLKIPTFAVTATATTPGGEKTRTWRGGIESVFDGSVYVATDGDPAVYTVDGALRWAVAKTTFDLRAKELATLDAAKLSRIELSRKKDPVVLVRDAEKRWRIQTPELPADEDAVLALINGVRNERVRTFHVDSPEQRTQLGLTRPQLDARFVSEGGEAVRLLLSAPAEGGETVAVLREQDGRTELAEVPVAVWIALSKTADALRDRRVLRLEQDRIARLELRLADGTKLELVKEGSDWKLVDGAERRATQAYKVTSLLWALTSLKAEGTAAEKPRDLEAFRLDRAAVFSGPDGQVLGTLLLGRTVPGNDARLYVRAEQGPVFTAEASRVSGFPRSAAELLAQAVESAAPTP